MGSVIMDSTKNEDFILSGMLLDSLGAKDDSGEN
jgi:hypothetical protein